MRGIASQFAGQLTLEEKRELVAELRAAIAEESLRIPRRAIPFSARVGCRAWRRLFRRPASTWGKPHSSSISRIALARTAFAALAPPSCKRRPVSKSVTFAATWTA